MVWYVLYFVGFHLEGAFHLFLPCSKQKEQLSSIHRDSLSNYSFHGILEYRTTEKGGNEMRYNLNTPILPLNLARYSAVIICNMVENFRT